MKTKGMLCMLTAAAVITIAITGNARAQQGNSQGSSQHKYTDDAIVRDLKAGKLTVREAQILQQRNDQAAAKTAPKAAAPANAPKSTAKKTHAAKPVTSVKSGKAGKDVKKKGKAPVKHLTSTHAKHGLHAPKSSAKTKPQHATAKGEPSKAVKPAKKKDKSEKDKTATRKPEPVRKTAVKYIR
ncbi:hypothetical protein hmeg3_05535 [Herbaspirillum sp. meg3]|jgi:hypothetical protein|uniref:hypothetical protein n=1 Tax=Herbaspirillum sp. meg3 TaxID=2025949 RepID=UPI000B980F13|nr:hypothetical protein [Herbaspirillum sp. meg3]ASU37811.1 hypothetical protein hmeg3_05535 [Herbaspirillum sp. meg3]